MESYEPYFVESISHVSEENKNKYYVFDVFSKYVDASDPDDEDFYYELHIKTVGCSIYYKDFIHDYIHVEVIDDDTLEIWNGEFEHECSSDGPVKYSVLELKKIEKAHRVEWKEKLIQLREDSTNLFRQKINAYIGTVNRVVENYQNTYNNSLPKLYAFGLTGESMSELSLFKQLYHFYDNNNNFDSSLNELINPFCHNSKQIKSWKDDFDQQYAKYENLKNIDVSNYQMIRDHTIKIYERFYKRMMSMALLNYSPIDENKYEKYFNHLMVKLKETN